MYQIKENKTERKDGDRRIIEYSYEYGWFENPINSDNFDNRRMRNPSNKWPFKSEVFTAQNVTLGKYRLNSGQIGMLGHNVKSITWND